MAHKQKLEALKKLDSLSEKLQKEVCRRKLSDVELMFDLAKGKLLDALQQMEKSLILRGHLFGLDSVEVFRACKSVGEMCNYLAMTYLQQGSILIDILVVIMFVRLTSTMIACMELMQVCFADEFDITLELLNKAVVLTERHRAIRAVTFNNLGCFYRK